MKYLYRCSIELSMEATWRDIKKDPVYVVSSSKTEAEKYVNDILKYGCKVKSVSLCGKQLSGILFRGK